VGTVIDMPRSILIRNRAALVFLVASVALFALAFKYPAYQFEQGMRQEMQSALSALLLGWLIALAGLVEIFTLRFYDAGATAWLANPLLLASWIALLFRSRRIAFPCAATAVLFAASFLSLKEIGMPSGRPQTILQLENAYYLWLLSTALALCAALCMPGKPRMNMEEQA